MCAHSNGQKTGQNNIVSATCTILVGFQRAKIDWRYPVGLNIFGYVRFQNTYGHGWNGQITVRLYFLWFILCDVDHLIGQKRFFLNEKHTHIHSIVDKQRCETYTSGEWTNNVRSFQFMSARTAHINTLLNCVHVHLHVTQYNSVLTHTLSHFVCVLINWAERTLFARPQHGRVSLHSVDK